MALLIVYYFVDLFFVKSVDILWVLELITSNKKYGEVTRIYGNCNYWAKRKHQGVCTPHSVKYFEIEEIVLKELRRMCKKYINTNMLENALKILIN